MYCRLWVAFFKDDFMTAALPFDVRRFDEAMQEAVEQAQVGFYFEEGGCWAMAEALFTALRERGLQPQLMWRPTDFVHAWVHVQGHNLDWRGLFAATPGARPLANIKMLRTAAWRVGGKHGEVYESDLAEATNVVQAALKSMEACTA